MSNLETPDKTPAETGKEWIVAAFATYVLALVAEWAALVWREETDDLARSMFAGKEAWLTPVLALPCAAVGAVALRACSRWIGSIRALEAKLALHCAGVCEGTLVAFSVIYAAAEGLFVRFWMQEWLGFAASVLIAVSMNLGPVVWKLWPAHLVLALLLGAMVEAGFGFAPATLAHALILYWSLRRILSL